MNSAKAKPHSVSPPSSINASNTSKLVTPVTSVRASVWLTDAFTIAIGEPRRMSLKLSRMRSYTTIVSFSE